MAYKAKLIQGVTYKVDGVTFRKGVETVVEKDLYNYLECNSAFEVSQGQEQNTPEDEGTPEDEKYTEAYLKKLNKEEQLRVLRDLSANHDRFEELVEPKNEEERIQQIMDLQGE